MGQNSSNRVTLFEMDKSFSGSSRFHRNVLGSMLCFKWKFSKTNYRFLLKALQVCAKMSRNIDFKEFSHFFRRKSAKIAENCAHNIDPRTQYNIGSSMWRHARSSSYFWSFA
jgi:hypothetical protein